MTIFTRIPFIYWGDRIGLSVMLLGIGAMCVAVLVRDQAKLDTLVTVCISVFGAAAIAVGVWAFFFWPWPTAITVDAKEVRVLLGAKETLVIPRKDIVRIGYASLAVGGGVGGGISIEYMVDGKKKFIRIYAHYRGEDGKVYKGWEISDVLNAVLGR